MNIIYSGSVYGMTGFATITRDIIMTLYNKNANIKIEPFDNDEIDILKTRGGKILKSLEKTKIKERPIWITQFLPKYIEPNIGYSIGYVVWESPDWPNRFIKKISRQDEIWTASEFNKRALKKRGIEAHLIPHGVNTELYNPNIEGFKRDKGTEDKFYFLTMMSWSARKGIDVLLRAYFEEFNYNENVRLLVKFNYYPFNKALEEIEIIKREINKKKFPRIELDTRCLSLTDMPKLYKMCDCFVLPSRGEGFGLNYTEAMAMGMPVIGTDACSMSEILNEDYAYLIKNDGYEINEDCDWLSPEYPGLRFAMPNKNSLRKRMREVFENRKEAREKGGNARQYMIKNYSWEVIGDKVWERLKEIDKKMVKFKVNL